MSLVETELLQTSLQRNVAPAVWSATLEHRQLSPEIMDDPALLVAAHQQALTGLARTNCWGSTRRHIWRTLCGIARRRNVNTLRILDVACGAGDLAIWLKRCAQQRGLHWLVAGCDKSPTAVEFAAERAAAAQVRSLRFFCCDALAELPSATYDVMLSTLVSASPCRS